MESEIGEPLTFRGRLMAVFLGTVYLLFLASMVAQFKGMSFPTAVAVVFSGAAIVMASFGALAMKFFRSGSQIRVELSTLFLLFVPLAVYLAAIRWFVRALAPLRGPSGVEWWVVFGTSFVALALVTTVVLLWFTEAIVWFAVRFLRWRRGAHVIDPWKFGGPDAHVVHKMLPMRRGHFVYESGHHGEMWLDLELLCARPEAVWPLAARLARRLARHEPEVVCGPLVEGAFVALMVAEELGLHGVEFCYAERIEHPERDGLFPVEYRLPAAWREKVRGRRVAIVNDVVNAGSAVRGTAADLKACGAELVALATLATIGTAADEIALEYGMAFYPLARIESQLWTPEECPLCKSGAVVDSA